MKKFMSFVLSMMLVLGMSAFAVSAEVATAEIKDGAVIEFENYAGEENKDLFVFTSEEEGRPSRPYGGLIESDYTNEGGIGLSGGAALGLAERTGATGMTFTIPVSVTESGLYDVEWYGTDGDDGKYLSCYTVSVGDSSFNAAGNSTLYFQPAKDNIKGDNTDLYYYPIRCTKTCIYLTEDTENLVITATPNTDGASSGLGIKMVLDCVKFDKHTVPTASWKKDAVIEMEDYISNIRYTFVEGKSNSAGFLAEKKASGGAVMDMKERHSIQAIEFDIPVEIEEDGLYTLNLIASTSDKENTSVLSIKEGDEEWVNNWKHSGYAGSELLYFGTEEAHKYYGVYDHKTVKYLTAGSHNLTAYAEGITLNPNATKFIADCLVIAADKTEIPADGKRMELEDYKTLFSRAPGRQTNNETGETFLSDLGGATTRFDTVLIFEESGYYNVTFHGSPWNSNGLSKVNFYLDDSLLMDNDNSVYGVDEGYLFAKYLPAWKFTKECIYIEAGVHTFEMEILARDPENPSNLCAHASDYLEFAKAQLPEVSTSETTVFEMEDYLSYIDYTYGPDGVNSASKVLEARASGGAVMDMTERAHIAAMEFDIPFVVTESGWYKINLVSSNGDVKDTSVLYIKDGDEEWVSSWVHSGYAGSTLYYGTEDDGKFRWYPVKNHETIRYIEAGEYTLTASASSIENQANATKFVADCLVLSPATTRISDNGTIELEEVKPFFTPWIPGSGVAAGNESVSMISALSGKDLKAEIPAYFEKSGYYDISFFGTPWKNNGLSKINISVDDTLIMNNDETKGAKDLGYNYGQYLPAYEFTKEFVYIEKGNRTIVVEAFMRDPDPEKNNECAFGMDAITFSLVGDEAVVNTSEKTVNVTAYYGLPTSGAFTAVAYCGNQMVGIASFDEIDRTIFDAIISYEGNVAPDTVKIFVWEDICGLKPVAEAKVISVK